MEMCNCYTGLRSAASLFYYKGCKNCEMSMISFGLYSWSVIWQPNNVKVGLSTMYLTLLKAVFEPKP